MKIKFKEAKNASFFIKKVRKTSLIFLYLWYNMSIEKNTDTKDREHERIKIMEEKSLKVLQTDTTFFNRLSKTLTMLLMPTKIGLNSMLINIKRNNVLKYYELVKSFDKESSDKKTQAQQRLEDGYSLYLEAIDKYIMDSIYRKVKNGSASDFEKNALSNYYTVIHLKDDEYQEYKYRKQKFLLDLDYDNIEVAGKDKVINRYLPLYIEKQDGIYKGILKNYSVKLIETSNPRRGGLINVYKSIFETLEDYAKTILPLKFKVEPGSKYQDIMSEYETFENFSVGKIDERDFLEKNMILLGLSRKLFTHSLPLVAAEQCYSKLLKDTRNLIVKTKKKEEAYQMLLKLIEDYNVKLLSTKVYWNSPEERNSYQKFWDAYKVANDSTTKEILSLKRELHDTSKESDKYKDIRKFYKEKLVNLGAMRTIKNSCKTLEGEFEKVIR